MRIKFAISLFLLILLIGCKQQSIAGNNPEQQTVTGRVVGTIKSPSDYVDINICNNAQTSGLCDGLNIAFEKGYKESCCNNYNICC